MNGGQFLHSELCLILQGSTSLLTFQNKFASGNELIECNKGSQSSFSSLNEMEGR